MSSILKSTFAALILASTLAPAALAQTADAKTSAEDASVRIAYDDLDISAPADAGILLKRIETAAGRVCARVVPRSPLTPRAQTLCRRDTVSAVVRDMSISTLTAAWTGQSGIRLASR